MKIKKDCNKKKTGLKKVVLFIVVFCLIIAVVTGYTIGYLCFIEKNDKAIVIMTLNYENSSSGLNPDNSKFNLRSFKSEEVLTEALKRADVSDHLTTSELASFISIKGVSAKPIDVESDTKYIDSTYEITLVLPEKYTGFVTAKKLLNEVCKSYKEWFVTSYVIDSKALTIKTDGFEEAEYSTISNYFDMMVIRGKNYLSEKEESTTAFTGSDGTTWKSLRQELSNLTEYDLKTFNQYIWENGIAKNQAWAITVLMHKNEDLNVDYQLHLANVDKYSLVVDEYRNEMTSSVLIPTYDDNEQFYMSRTKTGIDDISKSMDNFLEDATSLKEKIDINSDKIYKLENLTITTTQKADIMILNIQEKIINIFERIKKLDEEYVKEKTDDYVKYEFVEKDSFLTSFF
jgi:hypothetical protein